MIANSFLELANQVGGAPTPTGTKMRTKGDFCKLLRDYIRDKNWHDLFTKGGFGFFALVLHDELNLPLFYASPPGSNEFAHVFVMRGHECIDYCGKRSIEIVAQLYAGWPDEKPRPTCAGKINAKIVEKGCEEKLSKEIFLIAKNKFAQRKHEFL